MQVIGNLLKLPESNDLPLPWYHRGPLGLQSNTWCHVGFVKSHTRCAPELIVSVLDPADWEKMLRVKCVHQDEPGCVSKVMNALQNLKVDLLESATSAAGEEHELTLVCQCANGLRDRTVVEERLALEGFTGIRMALYDGPDVLWTWAVEVQSGWIRNVEWRSQMQKLCRDAGGDKLVDLSRAVVSADTTQRILRFVFPYHGARSIRVEHRDEPGVLQRITDVVSSCGLNVLSQVLRRGGASPGHAIWAATCEPANGQPSNSIYDELEQEFDRLPSRDRPRWSIKDGVECATAVTPREKHTVIARVPPDLRQKCLDVKSQAADGQLSVFFSHRALTDDRASSIYQEVREAVAAAGWHLLETQFDGKDGALIAHQVSAEMWAADAAIVIIVGTTASEALGRNIPHEWGFFEGQRKPIIAFVDNRLQDPHKLWSNIDGIHIPRFPEEDLAFRNTDPRSWRQQIIARLRRAERGRAP